MAVERLSFLGTLYRLTTYIVIALHMELICLGKPTVDEILQQGIHGPLETKPGERKKYLGTLRERIIVALKRSQVRETEVYPQIENNMKQYPDAHLFLNGSIEYQAISKYIKLAAKYKIEHTIVSNMENDTDIGLVLAMDHAIDKEEIYLASKAVKVTEPKKGLLAKLFKR